MRGVRTLVDSNPHFTETDNTCAIRSRWSELRIQSVGVSGLICRLANLISPPEPTYHPRSESYLKTLLPDCPLGVDRIISLISRYFLIIRSSHPVISTGPVYELVSYCPPAVLEFT